MSFIFSDAISIFILCLPVLALFWLLMIRHAHRQGRSINFARSAVISIFILYVVDVFWNTVSFNVFPLQLRGNINLVPLIGIVKMAIAILQSNNPWSFVNLFGNLALFIPLGLLLPLLYEKMDKIWKIAFFGFCLSVAIELWQLVLPRASDVDDVILNTIGALVGFLIFLAIKKVAPALVGKIRTQID